MNSGRPAFRFAPCGLHSDSPCQTAAIVLAGACAPSFGKIHCPWPKPRGMERRSAPHQFKLRLLAKTLRLPALHHGVLNPGPRFSEDRHRPPSQPSSWQAVLALLPAEFCRQETRVKRRCRRAVPTGLPVSRVRNTTAGAVLDPHNRSHRSRPLEGSRSEQPKGGSEGWGKTFLFANEINGQMW
jgi:hypothetical protein